MQGSMTGGVGVEYVFMDGGCTHPSPRLTVRGFEAPAKALAQPALRSALHAQLSRPIGVSADTSPFDIDVLNDTRGWQAAAVT